MIEGINHITLAVSDLDVSFDFYAKILHFIPLARWDKGAYFMAGNLWLCLSLNDNAWVEASADYTHTAFDVRKENFKSVSERIINSGAIIWKENSSEGDSLYFLDPDKHKLEIHASSLQERLNACRVAPYKGMRFF